MDQNQFQTQIISLHGYSMSHPMTLLVVGLLSATCPASVTQWYMYNTRTALVSHLIMCITFVVAYIPAIKAKTFLYIIYFLEFQ